MRCAARASRTLDVTSAAGQHGARRSAATQRREAAMPRSTRLLAVLQALRGRRVPVVAATLARELGVSERTIYRDIAALIAQGAPIRGEAGLGYVLGPGMFLPPLMLTEDEADAV